MRQRKTDFVKLKLKLIVLQSDFQNAVSRMLVLTYIIGNRMRRLGIGNQAIAGLAARFGARLLILQPDIERAVSPRYLVHAQQTLIHVVADRVVEAGDMVADHKHNHSNVFVGHE